MTRIRDIETYRLSHRPVYSYMETCTACKCLSRRETAEALKREVRKLYESCKHVIPKKLQADYEAVMRSIDGDVIHG